MKIKKIALSVGLLSLLVLGSINASANENNQSSMIKTGILLKEDGNLKIVGAKVTSITAGAINATVVLGESSINFKINIDNDTKINGKKVDQSVIDMFKTGDKLNFEGKMTSSTNSAITVTASRVSSNVLLMVDLLNKNTFSGTVKSVNNDNDTFTIQIKDRTIEVKTSASTIITLDGKIETFSSIDVNDKVNIKGNINTALSVITAEKITVNDKSEDNDKKHKDKKGEDKGKKKGWLWELGNIFKR